MNRERGFSLVELMVVISILSVLFRMSVPAAESYRRHAVAAQAISDFQVVRSAAYAQLDATGAFAPDAAPGVVPAGAAQFLPRDFSFVRLQYQLDWDHVALVDSSGGSGYVTMLSVVTADSLLGHELISRLGAGTPHWSVGDAHTFVVASDTDSH